MDIEVLERLALAVINYYICCHPEHKGALIELGQTPFDTGLKIHKYETIAKESESRALGLSKFSGHPRKPLE